jgi:glycolate oxidase
MLIAQSDAPGAACAAEIELMEAACTTAGAKDVFVTTDPDEGELFVAARRAAFSAIESRGSILLEDVGAPVPQLPQLLSGIAALADSYAVEIPVVAHAGDGNTHPIVIYDRGDPDARDRAYLAFDEIMQLAINLGGTITGEHGVGRAKKAALPAQLGPDVMALSQTIKNALDPLGILNPGAIF